MSITQTLSAMKTDLPTVITAGNVDEVKRARVRLVNLRKTVAELVTVFDHCLIAAQNGFAGDDFLVEIVTDSDGSEIRRPVEPIIDRSNRGRKASAKPEVDPNDYL